MSNTELEQVLAGQPQDVRDEILRINTEVRPRALQFALLVPLLVGLVGTVNGFRMRRLPDPQPNAAIEGAAFG